MAESIRVFVKRKITPPLDDVNLIQITDYKAPFGVEIWQQIGNKEPEKVDETLFIPEVLTPEPPIPPVVEGDVIWDSNRDGKWNDGNKRTVTKSEGNITPNGKGIEMRASGKPKLDIAGDGSARLVCEAGHGRFYAFATNFNSRLELEFNFHMQTTDNLSLKLRCRHQEGGACEHRFGGYGASISLDEVGCKREDCHNIHANSKSKALAQKLKIGQWYKGAFTVKNSEDNKSVLYICEIDYGDGKGFVNVLSHSDPSPKPYMMDRASFEENSYFWVRQNNEAHAEVGLKNLKLINLG